MTRGVAHEQQLRAEVVAELLAGSGSIGEVARRHGISKSTAASWLATDAPEHDAGAALQARIDQRYASLGERLIDLVEVLNQTIIRQCDVLSDPAWVSKQNAEDMATLVEALNERQIRVLSGYREPEPRPAAAP